MHDLAHDPPEGIKVTLNEQDVTDIQACIEGPGKYFPIFNHTEICLTGVCIQSHFFIN